MAEILLSTKLHTPPPSSRLVTRPRLTERLRAGLSGKLTLISAPAGFGKTTLVAEWLRQEGVPAAWLSLDRNDNDLAVFFSYLVAALQRIDECIVRGVHGLLQSPQPPPPRTLVMELINDLTANAALTPFVLVLDDFHLLKDLPSLEAMDLLLEHKPPQMHLVITTREDPPLPLARLRARGQLTELRASDLRFSQAEAASFLNKVMGLHLSVDDVASLEERTEGWIAGLQLAALSLQNEDKPSEFIAAFAGDDRHVMDYLVDEVLAWQSEEVRNFLMHTAILERLCAPLCDAVVFGSGSPGASQDILEYLETANLFIEALDTRRGWYRYHHLFSDLLYNRLRRAGPEHVLEGHRRASDWYQGEGLISEAVHHALAGQDYERAATLIESVAMVLVTHSRLATLLIWLDRLPEALVDARPWLCVARAWAGVLSAQTDAGEALLQRAEAVVSEGSPETYTDYPRISGHVAIIRAFVARWQGDNQRSIELSHEALAYLPEGDQAARSALSLNLGNAHMEQGEVTTARPYFEEAIRVAERGDNYYASLTAVTNLARLQQMQGHLHAASRICRRAIQLGTKWGGGQPLLPTSHCYVKLGKLLYEWNDLDEALSQLTRGVELGEQAGDGPIVLEGTLALAGLKHAQGDEHAVNEALDRAQELRSALTRMAPFGRIWSMQAQLWLAQGDLDSARRWANERERHLSGKLDYRFIDEHLALVRVFTAQGKPAEALALLAPLLELAETQSRAGDAILMLGLEAVALQAQGEIDHALAVLARALSLAEPEGYARTFIDQGAPMARLLYEAARRGIMPEYAGRLLAAFPVAQPEAVSSSPAELIEPLSDREMEVLQFIAAGASNPEVAAELVISINTVKNHLKNIYGKLHVGTRTQAIARARDLGLI